MRNTRASIGLALLAGICLAQDSAPPSRPGRAIKVVLEIKDGDAWRAQDSRIVLRTNDEIRFRFNSSTGGYLYVFSIGSDGKNSWLFPRPAKAISRVEPGPDYVIPDQSSSLVIGGPPGYEVIYWVLSPAPLDGLAPATPPRGSQPNTLRPRCREEALQQRTCVDAHAGAGPVSNAGELPLSLGTGKDRLVARSLSFSSEKNSDRITTPDSEPSVIVYEFRVAHN